MNDDIEGRLRTGLTALAEHARSEPTRSLTLEDGSNESPSHSRLRRLTAAAAVACVAAGAAVLLTWDRGDDPDSSPAPTTEATAPPSGTLLPPIDGCPADRPGDWSLGTHPSADYFDFVKLNGLMYEGDSTGQMDTRTGSLTRSQLGQRLGVVCFTLSEIKADLDAPLQDGDASFVPRGTELYAIKGSDPARRVVAVIGDRLAVYEVHEVPDASTGAEAIDLGSGFASIEIWVEDPETAMTLPPGSPTTQLPAGQHGIIDDVDVVRGLIDDLATSAVRQQMVGDDDGSSYVIHLHRADGTTTELAFHPETSVLRPSNRLAPAIVVPATWGSAVGRALKPADSSLDGDDSFDLSAPTVGPADVPQPPLGQLVEFVPCEEANQAVGGVLQRGISMATEATKIHCFVEPGGGDRQHASVLVVRRGQDVRSRSIIQVVDDGGVLVSATTGLSEDFAIPRDSDPDAPGGGYASFALDADTRAYVVRTDESRAQVQFDQPAVGGEHVRVTVSASGSPDEVVALARSVYADM